jgi:BirA family biotin operon repressor/biotin-[acetyl-CoA-carboxylase] ligase
LPSLADLRVSNADKRVVRYDGVSADALDAQLSVPRVELLASVSSTQDVAHALAADGAPAGTLVLADHQTAGRGRHGRTWTSDPGAGVWLTLIERPTDPAAVDVLSLRVGMAIARALEPFAADAVRLKWPNDVYTGGRKLAGVLAEARWRDGAVEWVSLGVGINVHAPASQPAAAGLAPKTTRLDVLRAVVPRLRVAAGSIGRLNDAELAEFAARDLAVGCDCLEPAAGRVVGIDASGALLIDTGLRTIGVRAGSLVLQEEAS